MSNGRFKEGLYKLLPAVVRQRDQEAGKQLEQVLEKFAEQADRMEAAIGSSYDNLFVETADPRSLAYLADLIGYRPIFPPEPGAEQGDVRSALLRRDLGRTMWARRRKGTAHALGELITSITGWRTSVFENGLNIVATPSVRFAAAAPSAQGTPDVRKLVGPAGVDQGPGAIPRVATTGRMGARGEGARWHPLDVVVVVWPHRASLSFHEAGRQDHYFTFDPKGRDIRLYAPADVETDVTPTVESVRALHMSDFHGREGTSFKERIYGPNASLYLYKIEKGERVEIGADLVNFSRFSDADGQIAEPPDQEIWRIDPERGRIQAPVSYRGAMIHVRYLVAVSTPKDDEDLELMLEIVRTRLNEHVPLEARSGLVPRK